MISRIETLTNDPYPTFGVIYASDATIMLQSYWDCGRPSGFAKVERWAKDTWSLPDFYGVLWHAQAATSDQQKSPRIPTKSNCWPVVISCDIPLGFMRLVPWDGKNAILFEL